MDVEAALRELVDVLREERAAIRRLDGQAVTQAAEHKERLVGALSKAPREELERAKERIAHVRAELRRNGTLLAHARDCLKTALEITRDAGGMKRLSTSV